MRALAYRSLASASLATGVLIALSLAACVANEKAPSASPSSETGPPNTAANSPPGAERDGQLNSCGAPPSKPRGSCGGCSVNCGDKQAMCIAGEEWPSGGPSCQRTAVCECH